MLEDGGNRLRRIIVSGNREVDKLGVGVGVHEGEGGDVKAAGLGDGDVLLYTDDKKTLEPVLNTVKLKTKKPYEFVIQPSGGTMIMK